MQNKRKATDRDWDGLRQILGDPENKKEAETAAEMASVINQERRDRVLRDLSYVIVDGIPIFSNLASKETQEERLFARKTFEHFMKNKIASSGLDSTQKAMLLDLLDNDSYEDLPKSIDEKLKTTGYTKAKVDSFILEVKALIIGVGHLLDRLKSGLFSQKLPSQATVIKEKHTETPTAPLPTPRSPIKPISTGDLKTAMSIPAVPSREAPPPVARPLTGTGAIRPPKPATAPVQKKEQGRLSPATPPREAPPPVARPLIGSGAAKKSQSPNPATTKASVTLQAKPKPMQKKEKEQGRLLPATPPAKTQEKTAPKDSVRGKIDFFKQLEQQQLPHGEQPKKSTTRMSHKQG